MDKFIVRIPYSFRRYGTLTADVYAESIEKAEDLVCDCSNHYNEDYDDSDDDGDTEYDYSDMHVEHVEDNAAAC